MRINAETKIAAILKERPDALEAIVSLSPDFKKLRNPVLRKLMGGRTSIAMASRIGGCTPADFIDKLKPFGFEGDTDPREVEKSEQVDVPVFIRRIDSSKVVTLDVRNMLADGNDPLKHIQQKVQSLEIGQVLKIVNSFEPTPLMKLLEKQGFLCHADKISSDLVETYFYKSATDTSVNHGTQQDNTEDSFEQLFDKYQGSLIKIDVRHFEMPMPMTIILEALEGLPANQALYVHHKRIPVFLLTELTERDFEYRIKEISGGEVFLLIFKKIGQAEE